LTGWSDAECCSRLCTLLHVSSCRYLVFVRRFANVAALQLLFKGSSNSKNCAQRLHHLLYKKALHRLPSLMNILILIVLLQWCRKLTMKSQCMRKNEGSLKFPVLRTWLLQQENKGRKDLIFEKVKVWIQNLRGTLKPLHYWNQRGYMSRMSCCFWFFFAEGTSMKQAGFVLIRHHLLLARSRSMPN
jgi:hypothetical protein